MLTSAKQSNCNEENHISVKTNTDAKKPSKLNLN